MYEIGIHALRLRPYRADEAPSGSFYMQSAAIMNNNPTSTSVSKKRSTTSAETDSVSKKARTDETVAMSAEMALEEDVSAFGEEIANSIDLSWEDEDDQGNTSASASANPDHISKKARTDENVAMSAEMANPCRDIVKRCMTAMATSKLIWDAVQNFEMDVVPPYYYPSNVPFIWKTSVENSGHRYEMTAKMLPFVTKTKSRSKKDTLVTKLKAQANDIEITATVSEGDLLRTSLSLKLQPNDMRSEYSELGRRFDCDDEDDEDDEEDDEIEEEEMDNGKKKRPTCNQLFKSRADTLVKDLDDKDVFRKVLIPVIQRGIAAATLPSNIKLVSTKVPSKALVLDALGFIGCEDQEFLSEYHAGAFLIKSIVNFAMRVAGTPGKPTKYGLGIKSPDKTKFNAGLGKISYSELPSTKINLFNGLHKPILAAASLSLYEEHLDKVLEQHDIDGQLDIAIKAILGPSLEICFRSPALKEAKFAHSSHNNSVLTAENKLEKERRIESDKLRDEAERQKDEAERKNEELKERLRVVTEECKKLSDQINILTKEQVDNNIKISDIQVKLRDPSLTQDQRKEMEKEMRRLRSKNAHLAADLADQAYDLEEATEQHQQLRRSARIAAQ